MPREDRELLEKQLQFVNLLLKYRQVSKLLSTFLVPFEKFVERDGRIRPSFHNTTCVTGRLSCSRPNIEQLPKNNPVANIRNLFTVERGNVIIVADYSGQEVRIMAQESGDLNLKSALRKGYDIHLATANEIHNLNIPTLGLTDKTPEHEVVKTKYKKQRDDCKCVVFGTAYGKMAYGFSKDFNCSEKEAQVFINSFFRRYPGLKRAIEQTRQQIYKHGFVKTMSGRKRRFPDFHKLNKWGKERCYRMGFNFKIQGYGGEVLKKAASEIVKNPNLMLVNLVHDEVVVECKRGYVEEGMKYIENCMVKALPIFIPWDINMSWGTHYGECH